jgi:hypothetical protein
MLTFMNARNRKIENKDALTALLMTSNNHATRIQQAIREDNYVYTTVIEVCLNQKSGLVQPQVLSPNRLMEILKISEDSFPRDLEVPVILSQAYAYMLLDISRIDSYLADNKLIYIVLIPLVMPPVYNVFRIIPFPMPIEGTEGSYTLIQPEKEFIVIDNVKGGFFFCKFERSDIEKCKSIQFKELLCKQDFPLFSSHMSTDCEVQVLQPIRLVPQGCTRKVVEVRETLWVPLRENTWMYVAPMSEELTVICTGQQPTTVEIKASGMLSFLFACTGYGNHVIIKSLTVQSVNNMARDSSQLSRLLQDCCEMTTDTPALGNKNFETPINSIPTHDEEMHVASHKVHNVEKLVEEQEANQARKERVSMLSVFGTVISVVFCIGLCCCCLCQCCNNCWIRVMR